MEMESTQKKQNVTDLRNVGDALVDAYVAASDGLGIDDIDDAQNVMVAVFKAADDVKVDLECALEETASQILRRVAQMRRDRKGIITVE